MNRPLAHSFSHVLAATFLALPFAAHAADIAPVAEGKSGLKPPARVVEPHLQPASDEPEKQAKKFTLLPGFKVDLWAAEPLLGNPVAFSIDEKGRLFTAETYRYRTSTLDIRHYMFMLEDDLANRTTDDRIATTKKNFPGEWQQLEKETEVVRLIEDRDGDGKADSSTEYAADMRTILDGINSGVLAHDGKVWCTNMPNLWLFSGLTKDGKAEKRESLSFGYGVRFSFTGHDMHGLQLGPDGRLYFSFGDRGAYVKTKEGKTLAFSDEGGVFRCEPDGSHLEAVARGLRNPQELAFDNHGNLFTGDNDSDQGDRERWEYIVEGGDYGWRIGWQHNPLSKTGNSWLAEKLWEPRTTATPAYVLSPIVLLPDGPSGVAHYPGTGLPAEFADHFFVCGFKGSSARSAIAMLQVKEDGAGFAVVKEPTPFIDHVQATDFDFGPDSQMYFSEWGEGWEGTGRGRIFKMGHTAALAEQAVQVAEVKKLLGEGFAQRPSAELAKLLGHPDQRIRLHAQWALAEKGDAQKTFAAVAVKGAEPLARLHAIWGLGHVARLAGYKTAGAENAILSPLVPLLADADAEVRAQTAKVLGDGKVTAACSSLVNALGDENGRVKFFAAQSLGKLGRLDAAPQIIAMLRANADKDEFLRHAGVVALASLGNAKALSAAAKDESVAVRRAALLVMRRTQSAEVAQFLSDADPALVKEAAHAINDEGILLAQPALAKLLAAASPDEQVTLRVINANYRIGNAETATALATFAAADGSETLRVEALHALGIWAKPPARDRVAGIFRPLPERDGKPAALALKTALAKLLADQNEHVAIAALDAAASLWMKDATAEIGALMSQPKVPVKVRGKALETLAALDDPKLSDAVKIALTDKDAALRVQATALLAKLDPNEAAKQLSAAYAGAAVAEKKAILVALGEIKSAAVDQEIATLLDDLAAGKVPGEAQLELLEAAAKREGADVKTQLAAYSAELPQGDLVAKFQPSLLGGDRAAGEKLFQEHPVAACLRCHKVGGVGGDAGPDLAGLGTRKDRRYILESIVNPSAQIADGFQSLLVTMKNGDMQVGVVKKEAGGELTLQMPVPGTPPVTVKTADIKSRDNAPSGMPPNMPDLLTPREIRDLVEYLASLK